MGTTSLLVVQLPGWMRSAFPLCRTVRSVWTATASCAPDARNNRAAESSIAARDATSSRIGLAEPSSAWGEVRRHSGQVIVTADFSGSIDSAAPNPDWRPNAHGWESRRSGCRQRSHDSQQGAHAAAFLIEGVRGNAGGNLVAMERSAHGNRLDGWKPAPDHREQLETGHPRHIEIRKKNVGSFPGASPPMPRCRPLRFARWYPISVSTCDMRIRIVGSSSTMRRLAFVSGILSPRRGNFRRDRASVALIRIAMLFNFAQVG